MTLTLCMAVKDAEPSIERCLMSAKPYVDEMIVIDQGSTDKTIDIATRCGAKVEFYPWMNDEGQIRNFAFDHARGDWVMYLRQNEGVAPGGVPATLRNTLDLCAANTDITAVKVAIILGESDTIDQVRIIRRARGMWIGVASPCLTTDNGRTMTYEKISVISYHMEDNALV